MGLVVPVDWTVFGQIIIDHIKADKPTYLGPSKKDQEIAHSVWVRGRAARAQFLAYLGTTERIRLMAPLLAHETRKYVNQVDDHEVTKWLNSVEESWKAGDFKDVSDEDFIEGLRRQFDEVVVKGDGWWEVYEGTRRDLVVAGAIPPLDRDRAWLEEQAELMRSLHTPYEAALKRLDEQDLVELTKGRP